MFEHLGYYKEYYIDNKFIGVVNDCTKDREIMGYVGQKKETTTEKITLRNGKIIKANTEVTTLLYPLCGKVIK